MARTAARWRALAALTGLGNALGATGALGAAMHGSEPGGSGGPGGMARQRRSRPRWRRARRPRTVARSAGRRRRDPERAGSVGGHRRQRRDRAPARRRHAPRPPDRRPNAIAVKQRLADVVDRLPDEVRHQLLRVVPNDDPRKCDLLTAVLDDLPTQRLLDLVPRVEMKRGTHVSPFLTFLVRLCSVAAREASVSEAVETQLGRFGLPTDLVHAGSDHVRAVLEQAFSQTAEHYSNVGELYQSSINEFSITFEPSPDEEVAQAARPGRERPADDRARGPHRHGAGALRPARHRDGQLPDVRPRRGHHARSPAKARCRCSPSSPRSPPSSARPAPTARRGPSSRSAWRLCRQPMALEQLINAVGDHVGAPSETLTALFLASGLSGTVLAVTRMTDLPDGAFRDRLGELVARQELEIVRSALTRLRKDDHPVMIVLNVLRVLDPIRAPELCRLFIRDPDAGIRRLVARHAARSAALAGQARARDDPGDERSRRRRGADRAQRSVRQPDAERAVGADASTCRGSTTASSNAADRRGRPAAATRGRAAPPTSSPPRCAPAATSSTAARAASRR